MALTVLLGSLQAHDGHEGQKSRAQVCLGRGGEVTGGRRVRRGFRQELAPVGGIGVDVVEIGCSFTKKGGCEGGHGCMGQRGGPPCGESGCWRMVGACLARARARLVMKAAASSLHLPPTSIASTTKRQRYLPARRLGWPSRVRGETRVVSTTSCAPFQSGRPLAMTSIRRSSCWWGWLMLRSLTLALVVSRAPASLQMRAVARSSGPPRLRRTPDWAQAARWSPRRSRIRCGRSRGVVAVGGGEGSP